MCGIAGTINVSDGEEAVRMMLHSLQNRGQQAVGIADTNGTIHRAAGTVNDIPQEVLVTLVGNIVVGHNRYATADNSSGPENMQPFQMEVDGEPIAIAHNGNFTNIKSLEETLLTGVPFVSKSDTERFFRMLLREYRTASLEESIVSTLKHMEGSCSALISLPGRLLAIRDSTGNRPLVWGKSGDGFAVASETSALDAIGIFEWKEVKPGTIVTFTDDGQVFESAEFGSNVRRFCPFELVYFGQVTSSLYGINVANIREDFGRALALQHPVDADIIIGIPDSGTLSAIGFSAENSSGVFDPGAIIRRHNTGRTFIRSAQAKRERGVSDKFGFSTEKIRGKRVVVVDDSLVRGTTSHRITSSLRERGATEVHWRIPSPPVTGPCHYGIATKDGELLAAEHTIDQMREFIGADSLQFLSMESFQSVIAQHGVMPNDFCFACMDGAYWHKN